MRRGVQRVRGAGMRRDLTEYEDWGALNPKGDSLYPHLCTWAVSVGGMEIKSLQTSVFLGEYEL